MTDKIFINPDDFKGFLPYVDAVIAAGDRISLTTIGINRLMIRLMNRHDGKDCNGVWKSPKNEQRYDALAELRMQVARRDARKDRFIENAEEILRNTTFNQISRRFRVSKED